MKKERIKIKYKLKEEWNEYEKRFHLMLNLMKMGIMLKKAKIEYPKKEDC